LVTLEGTPADWRRLREKVDLLAPFELDWWLGELRPICDQFARAAAGDVDRDHWRRLYKVRAAYGAEMINGWLGKLFPYTRDLKTGTFSQRNALLDPEVEAEIRKLEAEEARSGGLPRHRRFSAPGIEAEDLPRGLSQVPFTWIGTDGDRAMELVAGPIAVNQDGATGALRPTLGWAVCEAAPIEQALLRLAQHRLEPTQGGLSWEGLREVSRSYLPTDVLRFYRSAGSAEVHPGSGGALYRVFPLAEWREPEWAKKEDDSRSLIRFAELGDGTELVIQLYCRERKHTGAVFVGRDRAGVPVAESGEKVARSFTDFLLRALDGAGEPYFRRAGFVPLD
jgi:hypothetical protein